MADDAYLVDPKTKKLERVSAIPLAALGIKEVSDLEAWVCKMPELLGEELLVISSEFSHFDKSDRRLDVLALDKECTLTVVELKLELDGTFADQQAVRYAAFCSTMTTADMIKEMATYHGLSEGEAVNRISKFLGVAGLPELNNRPRIILAAGSLDDQELTSTVLWLRSFGVDITCVELTPYRLPSSNQLFLVPKIIIPLPEAKDFTVQVERKEVAKAQTVRVASKYSDFWSLVAASYEDLNLPHSFRLREKGGYLQLLVKKSNGIHYEWLMRSKEALLDVAVHFESSEERNQALIATLAPYRPDIVKDVQYDFSMGRWAEKWASAAFSIPIKQASLDQDLAKEAVRVMALLIQRTWPTLEKAILETKR
jgi:hypothetical protein